MKYFIVGLHASGKRAVADYLSERGVKCGKIYSNIPKGSDYIYNSKYYELFDSKDIYEIFENNAYLFMQEINHNMLDFSTEKYFEGLSKFEFDSNQVFVLSPDQLIQINPNSINDELCIVWMDNTESNRYARYHNEQRLYNFKFRDNLELQDMSTFVKAVYGFNNATNLYFTNEEPNRVATIIYNTIIHPDTLDMFVKNFN